ncbi:hypothetical protein RRG08_016229 [Elysia crispata]|uniref:Uncharacterized protein n=1 Tax=Elysia crispata TaxID=231223 RepID=A0AAE0ZQG7_9GAST|nr:hypothetical protein RRG08_016229 [Elysia crispata]
MAAVGTQRLAVARSLQALASTGTKPKCPSQDIGRRAPGPSEGSPKFTLSGADCGFAGYLCSVLNKFCSDTPPGHYISSPEARAGVCDDAVPGMSGSCWSRRDTHQRAKCTPVYLGLVGLLALWLPAVPGLSSTVPCLCSSEVEAEARPRAAPTGALDINPIWEGNMHQIMRNKTTPWTCRAQTDNKTRNLKHISYSRGRAGLKQTTKQGDFIHIVQPWTCRAETDNKTRELLTHVKACSHLCACQRNSQQEEENGVTPTSPANQLA